MMISSLCVFTESFFYFIGFYPIKQNAPRGSHCGGKEECRCRAPPQAENPACRILSYSDSVSESPQKVRRQSPQIPTRPYMILEIQLMLPKRRATRFRLKKPISPQLTAPMMEIVSAVYLKHLLPISHHPFVSLWLQTALTGIIKLLHFILFHGRQKICTAGSD